ncbi:MAG: hydrogenase formation protein HypD [Candidatus Thermoplasmatota archaeon]|nr:hydrogenase formation protein HypD [Candidatus Thermoplasmatota archaeon]MDI6855386.1 hydrogenase formation protein HypD [Candidatus Thermoplasmatota archaeon]
MLRYRDEKIALKIVSKLKALSLNITVMHVCGTHQDTLVRFGLEQLLRNAGAEIRQGPGCPVCVTTPKEIEEAILLAKKGFVITSFGDIIRVPGIKYSLADTRALGCKIKIVYSVDDAIELARKTNNEVVFLAIGFETTAPSTASAILNSPPDNFSILSCHRLIPPALKAIIELGELKLHGLIEPGHVSTVIGAKPYEFISKDYKIPQVIAGFEPLDLLMAVYMLAKQIKSENPKVEIEYTRSVKYDGNKKALSIMNSVFEPCDVAWRGFPLIPNSGLKLRAEFERYDAHKKFELQLKELEGIEPKEPKGCKCGEILRGLLDSEDCPLFGKSCTPATPVGPCMVSREGNCNIRFRYG